MFTAKIGNREQKLADLKVGEAEYLPPRHWPVRLMLRPPLHLMPSNVLLRRHDAPHSLPDTAGQPCASELNSADVKEWKGIVESAHITPNQKVDVEVQAYAFRPMVVGS